MDVPSGLLLGVLQGLFEWLPVSSEGQNMLVAYNYLGLEPSTALSMAIYLHLGTTGAVLLRFRPEIMGLMRNPRSHLAQVILVSTIATGITGIPLYMLLKETFTLGDWVNGLIGALLIITGIILRFGRGDGRKNIEEMSIADTIILGLAQGFAILPGVSRSGTTIATLLLRGVRQETALTVSFLISIPIVLIIVAVDYGFAHSTPLEVAVAMFGSALIVGYASMNLLLRFARKTDFSLFCIALGGIALIIFLGL